jgi:hypothetical protein
MNSISKMNNTSIRVEQIHIPNPCTQNWNKLKGQDGKKFCDICQKHVHDVTNKTQDDLDELLNQNQGRVCISIENKSTSRFSHVNWVFAILLLWGITRCGRTSGEKTRLTGDTIGIQSLDSSKVCAPLNK